MTTLIQVWSDNAAWAMQMKPIMESDVDMTGVTPAIDQILIWPAVGASVNKFVEFKARVKRVIVHFNMDQFPPLHDGINVRAHAVTLHCIKMDNDDPE